MKKSILKIIILFLICIAQTSLLAQEIEKNYGDRIILNNGSVFRGELTDYDPSGSVSLEMKSGKTLLFHNDQVKKIIMYSGSKSVEQVPLKTNRIYNETQFSFLTGVSGTGISIAHNVIYQPTTRIGAGLGLGIDNYYAAPGRDIYSFFGNVKYNFTSWKNTPYIGAKAGYGFAFKQKKENIYEASGGFMANPYFGVRFGSRGLMFNLFSGLKFQKANYELINSNETRTEDIFFKRSEIGISVMF